MIRTSTDLCLHLEDLKKIHHFETYTETVVHFIENESDQEVEQIARHLNEKIIESIRREATESNSLKDIERVIPLA